MILDICYCYDNNCEKRKLCFRFMNEIRKEQIKGKLCSFGMTLNKNSKKECDYFLEITKKLKKT